MASTSLARIEPTLRASEVGYVRGPPPLRERGRRSSRVHAVREQVRPESRARGEAAIRSDDAVQRGG